MYGAVRDPADLPLLRRIANSPLWQPYLMQWLVDRHPDWFAADIPGLYDQLATGDQAHSDLAARTILNLVRARPQGSFSGEDAAFLAAWNSGLQDEYLIQIIGYCDFDPAPCWCAGFRRILKRTGWWPKPSAPPTRVLSLPVTSRKVIWLFSEQLRVQLVPVLHRLQGRLAAQG